MSKKKCCHNKNLDECLDCFKIESVICECGAAVKKNYLQKHKKTKAHMNVIGMFDDLNINSPILQK